MKSKKSIRNLVVNINLIFLFGCHINVRDSILYQGYMIKGKIEINKGDTLFDGPINYYDSSGKLKLSVNYQNNKRNGQYIEYNNDGSLSQRINYENGRENGLSEIFDSNGILVSKENFFHGVQLGPRITYSKDTFNVFEFVNFDDVVWYRCEWDSSHKIIESGDLLQYVTNYYLLDGKLELAIFMYFINPPQKQITYWLFDKDNLSGDSSVIFSFKPDDTVFRKIYIDPPKKNHKYLWDIEAFYPGQNILFKNILNNQEREIKLPHSRY